jgi:hypothetical protein
LSVGTTGAQTLTSQSGITPLVVSRFAVRIAERDGLPDEKWIRRRAALLGRFTLPSLEHSGWSGLRWALLVDPGTFEPAWRALAPVLDRCRYTQPAIVRVEGEPGARTAISDDLEPLGLTADRILSIRLDTDDALLPGVIGRITAVAASAPPRTLVDLYSGYQYDTGTGLMRTDVRGSQGPFLAVVNDRRDNPLDAPELHGAARHDRDVRHLHGRSWIQVIHDGNVINTIHERSLRTRIASLLVHRNGGPRRPWTVASPNRDVSRPRARRVLASCGIATDVTVDLGNLT